MHSTIDDGRPRGAGTSGPGRAANCCGRPLYEMDGGPDRLVGGNGRSGPALDWVGGALARARAL